MCVYIGHLPLKQLYRQYDTPKLYRTLARKRVHLPLQCVIQVSLFALRATSSAVMPMEFFCSYCRCRHMNGTFSNGP